jgi:methyl-accepting chemotaxis protein
VSTTTSLALASQVQPVAPASAAPEFFRYHGMWAPGVRWFRRIGLRAKAWVIALTFLLPIAQLAWNYFGNQAAQIEFSAKERLGVAYAREITPVLALLQRERLLAVQGRAAELAAERAKLDRQLPALATAQQRLGAELGTAKAYAAWLDGRKALPEGGKADALLAAHGAHVQALLDLLGVSTDGSNLTLDPDIDSYYLMDASMFRLPLMSEAAAQIGAIGAAALAGGGQPTPAQARRLIEQAAVLSSNMAALAVGIDKAVAYNPALAGAVQVAELQAAVRAQLEQLDATLLRPEGATGEAAAHTAGAERTLAAMATLSASAAERLDALVAERVQRFEHGRNVAAAVLAAGLAMALYLFMAFTKVLDGGLREVAHHLDAMREGDLTTAVQPWGRDEAARVMHAVAQMQASLRHIVGQVRSASDRIVGNGDRIADGAGELSARTEQSAASLEETASAMEEIAATVRRGQDHAEQANQLAQANAGAAERGGAIIGEVVQTMQAINAGSDRIGHIVGTIDGIAFQTNILALNAAVEAARAGEQGRGFAVVASEVRALAQRSQAAAREIRGLIVASVEQAQGGARVAQQAGDAIGEIVTSARRVRELLDEVAVGAREQSSGVGQTLQAVQTLDAVTQRNAAMVHDTAAATRALQEQARALAAEVARFRLP